MNEHRALDAAMTAVLLGLLGLVVLHEAAHAAAAHALGLRWHLFARLPWKVGVAVWVETPAQRRLVALAGPAANLAAVAPLYVSGQVVLALVSGLMATLPSAVDWWAIR